MPFQDSSTSEKARPDQRLLLFPSVCWKESKRERERGELVRRRYQDGARELGVLGEIVEQRKERLN